MTDFHIDSETGRIGPFWWVNAVCSPITMLNATYNGSVHVVWREGFAGWDGIAHGRLLWRIVR
jgi:hypothetical protein